MIYLKMAWRNLWRNKRRTLITVASIFFGVLLSTIMASLQEGTYGNMVDMMVKLSSGYLQVQTPEYWEDKTVNNAFEPSPQLAGKIRESGLVTTVAGRFDSFGLISSGPNTRGGAVIGFEPELDSEVYNLRNWLSAGSFPVSGDDGVLVSFNIAKHLGLGVNDTIIIISQGYRGVTAAGAYPIRGILTFNTPQMNNLGVFMDLSLAQELFSAEGMVTSLVLMVDSYDDVMHVGNQVADIVGDQLTVLTWQELNPEIVQFIESDKAGGVVMIGILYIVIGFGIFGTVIMMVAERRKELGVMVAVGMKKIRLAAVLFSETMLIGLTGVLAGFAVSIPVIFMLLSNPIKLPEEMAEAYIQYGFEPYLYFGTASWVFLNQVITVFAITMLVAVYPVMKVYKLVVAHYLRS
jgi:putative ABC transport system permease protein